MEKVSNRVAAAVIRVTVRAYQVARAGRPSPCRYQPSCSQYALDAVAAHGAWRGLWLALRRLARCHPWGGFGWDPVPEPMAASGGCRAPLTAGAEAGSGLGCPRAAVDAPDARRKVKESAAA